MSHRARVSYTWDSLLVSGFGLLWVGGLVFWGITAANRFGRC